MAECAVQLGNKIGVAATLKSTLEPTVELLQEKAAAADKRVEIAECLCSGAFERVLAGDVETHDDIVSAALKELAKQVDAIVLAQASMAGIVEKLPAQRIPILCSPELAVRQARRILFAA
jgi:hypothetical protein